MLLQMYGLGDKAGQRKCQNTLIIYCQLFLSRLIFSKNMDLSTLNELYNITDCYVSPYRAEGFNLTPLEAAASGTPIIVTKGGSTDDYFNPKFGLQIDSKVINDGNLTSLRPNIESIVECILLIMENPKDYGGLEVSKFIEKNFTWYCSVKKLYNILIN